MRALGYTPPITHNEKLVGWELPAIQPLCFVGANEVVVTFTVPRDTESLPRRGDIGSLPLLLKGLFLDANDGKLESTREWPSSTNRARITPVFGTGFAVLTPDMLMLYSADMKLQKELPLFLSREAQPLSFTPYASPSGRQMIIDYDPVKGDYGFNLWINLPEMEVLKKWPRLNVRTTGWISDDGKTVNIDDRPGESGGSVGPPGELMADFPCPPASKACAGASLLLNSSFVSNDLLFSTTPPNRVRRFSIWLLRTDGKTVLEQELPEGEVIRPFYPVVGGGRFAIAVYKGHGGSALLDISQRFALKEIRIYDSESGHEVYTLDGKTQKIKLISTFALSADGSFLALIDQDGILRLYRIPSG